MHGGSYDERQCMVTHSLTLGYIERLTIIERVNLVVNFLDLNITGYSLLPCYKGVRALSF